MSRPPSSLMRLRFGAMRVATQVPIISEYMSQIFIFEASVHFNLHVVSGICFLEGTDLPETSCMCYQAVDNHFSLLGLSVSISSLEPVIVLPLLNVLLDYLPELRDFLSSDVVFLRQIFDPLMLYSSARFSVLLLLSSFLSDFLFQIPPLFFILLCCHIFCLLFVF